MAALDSGQKAALSSEPKRYLHDMKNDRFKNVLKELERLRGDLIEELRSTKGRQDLVNRKSEIDDAIKCLEFSQLHNLNTTAKVVELPYVQAGYFEYRIMIDNETDDRQYWEELKDDNGHSVTAIFGDVLILNSEAKKR